MNIVSADFVLGAAGWSGMPQDALPEIAFIGRSNVGKSSLLNMLVGRKALARTSNTPGKTQQFNYYLINGSLYFVDLPGYGYARISKQQRAKWRNLIARYLNQREALRLVFHLVDSRHAPTELDEDVILHMKGGDLPYVIVLTKADKLSGNDRTKSLKRIKDRLLSFGMEVPVILSSSKSKRGRTEILNWVKDLI